MIKYFKGEPNSYVILYQDGEIIKQGRGLAFWYLPFNKSIATVPVVTQDAPFVFREMTANFQEVAVQGQLTYRFEDPLYTARYLDFTIDTKTSRYRNRDPEKLVQRIINTVQAYTRTHVNQLELEEAIRDVKKITVDVLGNIRKEQVFKDLGVVIENLHITGIKPNPDMQKALEADYREGLQKRADKAIYERRAAAQEEEDSLKRKEMENDVQLEARRETLVEKQAKNHLTLAEAEAKGDEMKLNPYSSMTPQALMALALKDWANKGGEINQLNVNPDLLNELVKVFGTSRLNA